MIEFLRRLFGQQGSSATAKERLRLVLMTDHLELAPEMIEAMKRDLVDVISRYVEVDREKIDVSFERQDRTLAMLANIPILAVTRPSANGNGTHKPEEVMPPNAAAAPAPAPPAKPPVRKRRKRKKAQATAPVPAQAPAPAAAQ
ncbi:MAG TPA: cell division topological specificity factor MinE [Candidatus Cybelea sp.]|jgi:cell division topological specificity factor|nr:cell division topological specificity factor MinE [Candidatus Cybelea sp.]